MDVHSKQWHSYHRLNLEKRKGMRVERLIRRQNRTKHIQVPAVMHFFENYRITVEFIDSIKRLVFQENKFVYLDFSNCEKISSEACVVLAAEIDRCKRKRPYSVTGSYPKKFSVYYSLNELGFFKMLNISSPEPTFGDSSKIDVVKLKSGKEFERDYPENLMKDIKRLFYRENGNESVTSYSRNIYRALTEAAYNSVEHAYPQSFRDKEKKTCIPIWWRAGFKIKENNKVVVVLYDQGVGVPNTLDTNWKEQLRELSFALKREPYDHEKIDLAMKPGRSRTRSKWRGKGSHCMQSIIRENSDGLLNIFSYNGRYVYSSDEKWEIKSLDYSLGGTLIMWQVSLDRHGRGSNEEDN